MPRGSRACARTSRACGRRTGRVRTVARRRRRSPTAWWDGTSVRPHPCRRALHGVGHRAPPPGRQVAAARRRDIAAFGADSSADPRGAVAAARAGRACCSTPPARCSRRRTKRRIADFADRDTRTRCAKPSPFRPMCARRAANSCLRPETARATIRTASSTRGSARPRLERLTMAAAPRRRRPEARHSSRRQPSAILLPCRLLRSTVPRSAPSRASTRAGGLLAAGAAACSLLLPARRRADTIAGQVGRAAHRGRRGPAERRVRALAQPDARGGAATGHPALFRARVRADAPRWYWLDEKVAQTTLTTACRTNALTRQYRVASGLLAQTFELARGGRALRRPRHVAAGSRAPSATSSAARATTRACACASTSTSCRSRSR